MTRAGFEPALPKETVLETVALDHSANESKPPAGLEPAIYRLEVCRLIHWATGAVFAFLKDLFSSAGFEPATAGILFELCSYHYNPALYQLS